MADESENSVETPIAIGDWSGGCVPETTTDTAGESVTRDGSGYAVTDPGRRYVLRCLATSETPMALADLADELVRWNTGRSPTAAQDARERIYVSLYHWHLPKLAEAGLVSVDGDRKLVDLREDADEFPLDVTRTSRDGRQSEVPDDDHDR